MVKWFVKKVKKIIDQRLILMIYNFLHFLFDLFNFFDFFKKWKVILINLWRPLFHLNLRHSLFKLLIVIITQRVSLSLRFITNNTSLWYFWHKRTIRIDLFLYLYFFYNDLLFNNWFWWYEIFACMWVVNRKDFSRDKWISKFFIV